jgi:hypothetical protein
MPEQQEDEANEGKRLEGGQVALVSRQEPPEIAEPSESTL